MVPIKLIIIEYTIFMVSLKDGYYPDIYRIKIPLLNSFEPIICTLQI